MTSTFKPLILFILCFIWTFSIDGAQAGSQKPSSKCRPISSADTTITESGTYCLTKDIDVPDYSDRGRVLSTPHSGISIYSYALDVRIELRGHKINVGEGSYGISNVAPPNRVEVVGPGEIRGGRTGIHVSFGQKDNPDSNIELIVRNVNFSNLTEDGITTYDPKYLEVSKCTFENINSSAIDVEALSGDGRDSRVVIEDNEVRNVGRAFVLGDVSSSVIVDNDIEKYGEKTYRYLPESRDLSGIRIFSRDTDRRAAEGDNHQIIGNTFNQGGSGSIAINIKAGDAENEIRDNCVKGRNRYGIRTTSALDTISKNEISNSFRYGIQAPVGAMIRENTFHEINLGDIDLVEPEDFASFWEY